MARNFRDDNWIWQWFHNLEWKESSYLDIRPFFFEGVSHSGFFSSSLGVSSSAATSAGASSTGASSAAGAASSAWRTTV